MENIGNITESCESEESDEMSDNVTDEEGDVEVKGQYGIDLSRFVHRRSFDF
jgi:hypothetical protein